ncbi:hypothetical protein E4T44_10423 [Aureobasidium sp. EXF-8845]|nr:hypothetical protein E4T44_10423 [Aureobasidium sp. EXF-8845]KAI4828145.1 hypothetical protein E4T45_10292 [Aureobasidium sp. EXF-8846]
MTSEQPRLRPTTTQLSDLPPPYEDVARYGNWTLRFNNAFERRSFIGNQIEGYHYGISEDGGSTPDSFFICKRKSRGGGSVDFHCWQAVMYLQRHREKRGRNCHCDFQWIKCGRTERYTSRLCDWRAGKTGKSVLRQMRKHDEKYLGWRPLFGVGIGAEKQTTDVGVEEERGQA